MEHQHHTCCPAPLSWEKLFTLRNKYKKIKIEQAISIWKPLSIITASLWTAVENPQHEIHYQNSLVFRQQQQISNTTAADQWSSDSKNLTQIKLLLMHCNMIGLSSWTWRLAEGRALLLTSVYDIIGNCSDWWTIRAITKQSAALIVSSMWSFAGFLRWFKSWSFKLLSL